MKKTNTRFLKFFYLLLGTLFWSGTAFAQPANDLCGTAAILNCGDTGIAGTTIASTADDRPDGCFSLSEGVWYIIPGTGDNITVTVTPIGWDPEVNLQSGNCNNLTSISCNDAGGGGDAETVNFSSLVGTDYFIYVADWNNATGPGGNEGDFTIDVACEAPPMAPSNDDCANAIDLGNAEMGFCAGTTAGTTLGATESLPGCDGTANDDVWFSFTATDTNQDVTVTNTGGVTDIVTEVFDGCGGASLACQDSPDSPVNLTGLTVGNVYVFRVYTFSSLATSTTDFTVCVGSPPSAPVNDDCANATELIVGSGACAGPTLSNNVSSTISGELPEPTCSDIGLTGEDIWFTFTVPAGGEVIVDVTSGGGPTDWGMSIYSGVCGALTEVECDDDDGVGLFPSITLTGQTPGDILLIRLFEFLTDETGFVNICAYSPPPPPVNDFCAGAIPIVPSAPGTGCTNDTFTAPADIDGTTDSGVPQVCSNPGLDLWFTWTATSTGLIFNDGDGAPGIAVFASCADANAGIEISCANTFAPADSELSGWAIGDNLLIQVYDFNGSTSALSWCLEEFNPPPPPPNDACATAIDYETAFGPIGAVGSCPANMSMLDISEYSDSGIDPTCDFGNDATAWYTWTATANGISFDSGAGFPGLEILSGTCGAFTSLGCLNNSDGEITGLTIGTTYHMIIWDDGTNGTIIDWCIEALAPPPVNDACAAATPLPVTEGDACGVLTMGTNVSSTESGELPIPSCDVFEDGQDIWYAVTVPMSGAVNIEVSDAGGPTDWVMSLYSGVCGNLTEIACDDDTNGTFPAITATGLTPGDVLLVRLFEDGNDADGPVNICAFSPAAVCDVAVASEVVTDETCAGAEDGTITIATTTSFGPVTYALTGIVSMTNTTGIFTDLPQGTYSYTVTDNGFPAAAGPCTIMGGPLTIAGDATAPVISCPTNITITCNDQLEAVSSVDEFLAAGGIITEDCGIASITSVDISTGDNCNTTADQVITRLYTITDDSGNATTCEQMITVSNSLVGPVITEVPVDQIVDCAVNAIPQLNFFQASGDCGVDITTTVAEMPSTGTPGCNGSTISFMYTATDACGRTASHIQTYTIANDGPEFVCPTDICIIECPADNEMIQTQFDDYAGLATVLTSCSESEITITNSFNTNSFISQNCSNPSVSVEGAVAYQTVTFSATDACGRTSTCTALVVIKDNDGPVINGNIPLGTDDCANQDKQAAYDNWINLALGNLSAMDECSGTSTSVNYSPLSPNTNCQGGLATTVVAFTATDACGNQTVINANYRIIDLGSIPMATVSGALRTEENESVELVEVAVDGGSFNNMMMTSANGNYEFDLEINQNHTITPTRNDNHLNGITSYDLILLGQHLLEIQELDSPYKLIAADINRSGSITALDMIQLRRLILHIDETFLNNTSWRFVDADYTFSEVSNPFATTFPEAVSINNLSQAELHDFVAIKIGDLNGSAAPALLNAEGDTRDLNELVFQVDDQQLSANQTHTVDFKAKDFKDILGYQFTLAFDPSQLEMVDFAAGALESLSAENFGDRFNEGVLTSSWNAFEGVTIEDDATLFSITFKANANVSLSNAIHFNSELTSTEAYSQSESLLDLGLMFNNGSNVEAPGFALLQNRPNPFNNQTLIAFTLPEMTDATLTIYDVAGRIIKQYKGDFNKGYNEVTVNRADLSGSGLLYYQLETSTEVATMKMIVQ